MLKHIYDLFKACGNITTDSRSISGFANNGQKVIFFALKGDNFDGNTFVEAALKDGASYCIADDPSLNDDHRVIKVKNTLQTLQELASYHRNSLKIPIIAITGSNGKTTTKELLNAVLNKKYNCYATQGNLNNHIGVPLTLLKINESHNMAIVEMGANHCQEIAMLCDIAAPDYGIITNIGRAHLEGFGGEDGVKRGKGELYDYLSKNNKTAFYLSDSTTLSEMIANREALKSITYSTSSFKPLYERDALTLQTDSGDIVYTNLIGDYNITNVAVVYCVGRFFNIKDSAIKEALEEYLPSNHRSQLIEKGSCKIILDAYNANPSSMNVAIKNFAKMPFGNKVFIIGDMKELGDYALEEHINVLKQVKGCNYNHLFIVGNEFGKALKEFPIDHKWFSDSNALKDHLKNSPIKEALILIKGSNSTKLEHITEVL